MNIIAERAKEKLISQDYSRHTDLLSEVDYIILKWRELMLDGTITLERFENLKEKIYENLERYHWDLSKKHLWEIAHITEKEEANATTR